MTCVDIFNIKNECEFHVLTHVHTDHMRIPKKFKNKILCSDVTARLVSDDRLQPVKPGWHDNLFFVFKTNHIPGAIGVFYGSTLHIGENRLSDLQLHKLAKQLSGHRVDTVVYDSYFEGTSLWDTQLPTYRKSQNILKRLVTSHATIVIRHVGIVQILPKTWTYHWVREPETERERIIVRATQHLTFAKRAQVTLSFETKDDTSCIIPSIGYFSHHTLPVNDYHVDDSGHIHVPFSCHDNSRHVNTLKTLFPESELISDR